jgi:hypothetical protein
MHYLYENESHSYFHSDGEERGVRMLALPSQLPAMRRMLLNGSAVELHSAGIPLSIKPDGVPVAMSQLKAGGIAGWRPVSCEEYASLVLSREFYRVVFTPGEHDDAALSPWLENHPYVRGGGVFPFENLLSITTIALLANLGDIRRFETLSRLRGYLRLTTARDMSVTVDSLMQPLEPGKAMPAAIVASTWGCPAYLLSSEDTVRRLPRAFLYRDLLDWRAKYTKEMAEPHASISSVWRVTQRYVAFLYRVWLGRVTGQGFDPRAFFKRTDEAEEFESYIRKRDSCVDNLLELAKVPFGGAE